LPIIQLSSIFSPTKINIQASFFGHIINPFSTINFFSNPELGLETVPLKNKIENVLYSLITNNIISFDRAGSSYPQAASTGYEPFGSRKFKYTTSEKALSDNYTDYYTRIVDMNGTF